MKNKECTFPIMDPEVPIFPKYNSFSSNELAKPIDGIILFLEFFALLSFCTINIYTEQYINYIYTMIQIHHFQKNFTLHEPFAKPVLY